MTKHGVAHRPLHLFMPLVVWRLLGKYVAVVSYDRIKRNQSPLSYTDVISSILSWFLVDRAHEIERAFGEVWLACQKEELQLFYSRDELAAIAAASRTDIPYVYRARQCPRARALHHKRWRALQRVIKRSTHPAAGSAGESRQVRRIPAPFITRFGQWVPQSRKSQLRRKSAP